MTTTTAHACRARVDAVGGVRQAAPLRVTVLFDSAGFLRTLPLTGAAARTVHLNVALHHQGCPTTLLLCDLNPDSRPSSRWPLPVQYINYDDVYGDPTRLVAALRTTDPDVLVMSNTELTVRYGRATADAADAALVYEMHDDEAAMLASIGAPAADCRAAALLQVAAVGAADAVVAFTVRDVSRARELGAAHAYLVPCGAMPAAAPPALVETSSGPSSRAAVRVGFVGNLHYEPNLRALRYLATQLAPHLAGRAVIDVFGRYPAAARSIRDATPAGQLTLHGPVGNLPRALARMTLAVAPLDSGGGMKLKTLDYLAAGLPIAGTPEAVVGLDHPERVALLSHDAAMRDLPGLVDRLLADQHLRHQLGARGHQMVTERYSWPVVALTARRTYQSIAAARATRRRHTELVHHQHQIPREVIDLASRTPYWLAEWRSHDPRPQDSAIMTERTEQTDHGPERRRAPADRPPGNGAEQGGREVIGELVEAIECARLAATAALDIRFDIDTAAGYAGRSMVYFAADAVLKVYTHRAAERAHREITGIELAARHVPGLRLPEVLGHDEVPGGLSWVVTTRLPGTHPTRGDLADTACATRLGGIVARLHAIPVAHLSSLSPHTRRIRDLPPGDPVAADTARRLVAALEAAEPQQRPRCEHGFVHGDMSSRNVLLTSDPHDDRTPGVIDFEGSGAGCIYDDLATMIMQDGLLGDADPELLLAGYENERAGLGHPRPAVDRNHLTLHLGWRARWILQWAIEIDRPLTEGVLALAPALLAELTSGPAPENQR